ncbi:MAG: NADPH-dependent assimilatory sulfite reductase hemoprotein subunit [Candidatus Omnitrophica bacterium]|nr:NADPH-dependent assimilatory sulfite reductase hemoprotein subunit [Candidatus Omnitrophota bacterium]
MAGAIMANVEAIKKESQQLRGTLREALMSDAATLSESDHQLIKFHGAYEEDDRDQRVERRKQKLDRFYMFMVRSRIPGGRMTSKQYLMHDGVAEKYGDKTLRITSRQGIQFHFVMKGDLKECIAEINRSGLTTWGACGDVVRNVMASPLPLDSPAYRDIQALSEDLKDVFSAKSHAYSEIWLDDEKLDLGNEPQEDDIYGDVYLPRKFKIGIAVPPRNDVDLYSQDIGLVPHVEENKVLGYTFIVGGGMGMSHGKKNTYPVLGKPIFYVSREHVVEVCKAIVTAQRDFGNREDRKRARMKYLIEERGIGWLRSEVRSRLDEQIELSEPEEVVWRTVSDMLGWHEQGDGKLFLSVWVPEGRIHDAEQVKYRSGFREIAERFNLPIRLTPNCNIIFHDIDPANKEEIESILEKYEIPHANSLTETRKMGMACVALPTCGLALAESERVFQDLMCKIDAYLYEFHLQDEPILIRMTGCPNGCARPYNADISFVGKSPGKYVVYVGGSHRGDRLAGLEKKMVSLEEIPYLVRGYLEEFAENRFVGESFSDYWGRTHPLGDRPHPDQFHEEPAKREAAPQLYSIGRMR